MKIAIIILCFCVGTIYANLREQFDIILRKTDTIENKLIPILNFSTKCFDGLGCYSNGPPFFNPIMRPISLLPADNPHERIQFLLFTPFNKRDEQNYTLEMTEESLKNSHFNPNAKTMIWIHGWQLTLNSTDELFRIKDAIFEYTEEYQNFISVKWANYVGYSYEEALSNGRVVGTKTARMIEFLMNHTSATKENFHVVGHSLGGQLIAYVGQTIPGLYRLTALDASLSYFYGADLEVRLDPSDANFVDVIHANQGFSAFDGLGYPDPYGDQDFFPNGGQRQPGCGHEDPYKEELIEKNAVERYLMATCDHGRSVDFFLESIVNSNCTFKGTECDSYDDWKEGKCPSSTHIVAVMGINSKPIPGLPPSKFYLDTKARKPYCKKKGYKKPTRSNADL